MYSTKGREIVLGEIKRGYTGKQNTITQIFHLYVAYKAICLFSL